MTKFNEDSKVEIPSIWHLYRLGYEYISLKDSNWDFDTNIFTNIFRESILRINPELDIEKIDRILQDILITLDYENLGRVFYNKWWTNLVSI